MESHLPQLEARCWGQELQLPLVLGIPFLFILTNPRVSEDTLLKAGRTPEGPYHTSCPL